MRVLNSGNLVNFKSELVAFAVAICAVYGLSFSHAGIAQESDDETELNLQRTPSIHRLQFSEPAGKELDLPNGGKIFFPGWTLYLSADGVNRGFDPYKGGRILFQSKAVVFSDSNELVRRGFPDTALVLLYNNKGSAVLITSTKTILASVDKNGTVYLRCKDCRKKSGPLDQDVDRCAAHLAGSADPREKKGMTWEGAEGAHPTSTGRSYRQQVKRGHHGG